MLNFTEHMKWIIKLTEQCSRHAQAEKFEDATTDVMRISIHCNEAMQQLDEMSLLKQQSKDPSKNQN